MWSLKGGMECWSLVLVVFENAGNNILTQEKTILEEWGVYSYKINSLCIVRLSNYTSLHFETHFLMF